MEFSKQVFKTGACLTSMSVFFTNLVNGLVINRSSHLRYSVKKVFLEISQNSQTNQLCLSLFFNKVAGLRPATLLKKRHGHRCFPVNFVKFIRTPFYIEHIWWLLLHQIYLYRSSQLVVFCEKNVLGNFPKFIGKRLYQSLFLMKLQISGCSYIKKDTQAQVFSCEFFRTHFLTQHLQWPRLRLLVEKAPSWLFERVRNAKKSIYKICFSQYHCFNRFYMKYIQAGNNFMLSGNFEFTLSYILRKMIILPDHRPFLFERDGQETCQPDNINFSNQLNPYQLIPFCVQTFLLKIRALKSYHFHR